MRRSLPPSLAAARRVNVAFLPSFLLSECVYARSMYVGYARFISSWRIECARSQPASRQLQLPRVPCYAVSVVSSSPPPWLVVFFHVAEPCSDRVRVRPMRMIAFIISKTPAFRGASTHRQRLSCSVRWAGPRGRASRGLCPTVIGPSAAL